MGMECRWGQRKPIGLDAVIDCRHQRRLRGYIRDVSSSGAFVVAPVAGFTCNSLFDLVFTLHHGGVAQVHRVKAMVTRVAPDGAGLMFDEIMPPAISMLLASPPDHGTRPAARRISPPPGADSAGGPEPGADRTATG